MTNDEIAAWNDQYMDRNIRSNTKLYRWWMNFDILLRAWVLKRKKAKMLAKSQNKGWDYVRFYRVWRRVNV